MVFVALWSFQHVLNVMQRVEWSGVEWELHLDEELSILLDVLVSRLLLLFLLRLHRHVDVHPQLLTVQQTRATSFTLLLHHRHTFI